MKPAPRPLEQQASFASDECSGDSVAALEAEADELRSQVSDRV